MYCINAKSCVIMSRSKTKGAVDICGDCGCQGKKNFDKNILKVS